MRKSTVLLCMAAACLASCSSPWPWPWESTEKGPANPRKVLVGIVQGQIQVDQETAIVRADTGAVVWDLAPSAWGYRFADGGIRFEYPAPGAPAECKSTPDPAESFELRQCLPTAKGRQFVCPTRPNHIPGACFKYTVRLEPLAGSPAVPEKDPWIKNW